MGRIAERDLVWALRDELVARADEPIAFGLTRLALRSRIARHGVREASGTSLAWLLRETDTVGAAEPLWQACLEAARRAPRLFGAGRARSFRRHRDVLLADTGTDIDSWVNPALVRLLGGFLDQGLARWSMPGASRGLYACFMDLYSHRWARFCGRWAEGLAAMINEERRLGLGPEDSLRRSLDALGVGTDAAYPFLEATALVLRGWGGMVRQLEERPDWAPARSRPAALLDYLAVRLILERAALLYALRSKADPARGLADLAARLGRRAQPERAPSLEEHAWRLFQAAQACGLTAEQVASLSPGELAAFAAELAVFDGLARRRVLHAAYERRLRAGFCDALNGRRPRHSASNPSVQAIFCLDEREESFRRHLEETAPEIETFGAAGFFGVAMYFQGVTDARPRPLCPVSVRPDHYVGEVKADPASAVVRWRRARRRQAGRFGMFLHRFDGTFLGGYVITALLGPLSIVPLVLRVVFPSLSRRWLRALPLPGAPATRLLLDCQPVAPPVGRRFGYAKEEMAAIVGGLLRGIGVADRLARLVVVAGHGSTSLNNPHESAHDCGACGGGRGGPNARAFAQMANDPAVRDLLAREGLAIPPDTWFVGAMRNTCDNSVTFFDLDLLPASLEPEFNRVAAIFARARRKEAHERCRRFESFPLRGGYGAALAHVEARSQDLAQPRPEYGHASNAFCVVGRRSRTRGLFLDRRAFLMSYDPESDGDLSILEGTLASVVPVVAGISLEYYFSRVDPTGYGCGTKLPHNVASLLGVMNGTQSDLRAGLPWQMVEIHEPVRLFTVVECAPERLERVLGRLPAVRGLLDRRWLFVAALEPESGTLYLREASGYRAWVNEAAVPSVEGDSAAWYAGKRQHLPIAEIIAAPVPA